MLPAKIHHNTLSYQQTPEKNSKKPHVASHITIWNDVGLPTVE